MKTLLRPREATRPERSSSHDGIPEAPDSAARTDPAAGAWDRAEQMTGMPTERARPRRRHAARRRPTTRPLGVVPFVGLVAAILGGGLIALLLVNNALATGSFEQARLKAEGTRLFEQEQALAEEVERQSSPAGLERRARDLGLVPAGSTAYLDLATGRILGVPAAAKGGRDPDARTKPDGAPQPTMSGDAPTAGGGEPSDPEPSVTGDAPTSDGGEPSGSGSKTDGATVSGGTAYDRAIVSGASQ